MNLEAYLPVLIQIVLAVLMAVGILLASHFLGQRSARNKIKDSTYECGLISPGKTHPRFAVKFYVTAMLFILFDIEVVFLVPWALIYREFLHATLPIVLPIAFFLALLVIGLAYELKKGGVEWEK